MGPHDKTSSLGTRECCTTSSNCIRPEERKLDSPTDLSTRNARCTDGRRKSASISNTDEPSCASEIAVLTEVVVFPSPGWLLVNKIVFGGLPAVESNTEVRSMR